ncbi:GIY-YIG nuclease family protein [Reichenbachiella sp.]|uniref:GIY-YIG nuclease family protein n=1 Tax=Reichenbachiella sp. TaxID=2184521 RepID=UPI003B59739A
MLYSKSLDKFYKGQSSDLDNRLFRHNAKQDTATKSGAPWQLLWATEKKSRSEALTLEKS